MRGLVISYNGKNDWVNVYEIESMRSEKVESIGMFQKKENPYYIPVVHTSALGLEHISELSGFVFIVR